MRRESWGYKIRLRTKVTTTSARITMAKMAARIVATRFHWNRLSAESSVMPMPPAPTSPRTADSRTLMSQRNRAIDQNAGLTCGVERLDRARRRFLQGLTEELADKSDRSKSDRQRSGQGARPENSDKEQR